MNKEIIKCFERILRSQEAINQFSLQTAKALLRFIEVQERYNQILLNYIVGGSREKLAVRMELKSLISLSKYISDFTRREKQVDNHSQKEREE